MKAMPKVNHEEIISALLKNRLLQQKQSVIKLASLLKESWDDVKTEHIIVWMELFDAVESLRASLDNLEENGVESSRAGDYELEEMLQIFGGRLDQMRQRTRALLEQVVIPHAA